MTDQANQATQQKTRLTLASSSSRQVSVTHPPDLSAQSSKQERSIFRPLPKVQKPEKPPKEKLTTHQARLKKFREKKAIEARGPLAEAEDGEYDAKGFWVENPKPEPTPSQMEAQKKQDDDEAALNRDPPQQTQSEDPEAAIRKVLDDLAAMPSDQPYEDLFKLERPYGRGAKATNPVPAASTAPRRERNVRPKQGGPNTTIAPVKGTRLPTSAMRGQGKEDTPEDDEQGSILPIIASPTMPQSAQPQPSFPIHEPNDEPDDPYLRSYHDYNSDDDGAHHEVGLSPTERNSSAVLEPVARAKTRRSNDRNRVYSLEPSQLRHTALPVATTLEDDFQIAVPMTPPPPPSFAVSETEPPTQDAPRYTSAPAGRLQQVKIYGKKSAPTRSTRLTDRNPAERREFRDQLSPEPEWEQEHLNNDTARSKRAGSTSLWPPSGEAAQTDERGDDWEGSSNEGEEGEPRLILGELLVNERGQRLTRGRTRNGEWPDQKSLGLFHEDTPGEHPRSVDLLRPVSERFHLAQQQAYGYTDEVQYMPSPELDIKPDIKRHNDRANHDHPLAHPVARLNMSRSRSTADRLDVYTSRVNATSRHAKPPVLPSHIERPQLVKNQTRIKTARKRKSKFDIPILPVSILKPIKTILAAEYKQLRRRQVAGDGFHNPMLLKVGRIGTRDAILEQQAHPHSRSHSNGRSKSKGFRGRYPGEGIDDSDPVIPPTQDDSRASSAGFAVRQLERARNTTAKYQKLRPKLPFTSRSPPHLSTSTSTERDILAHGLRYTTRSPPRTGDNDYTPDWLQGQEISDNTAIPAVDVPGLVQPQVRLGFAARMNKRKVQLEDDDDSAAAKPSLRPGLGFRRRHGYHSPAPDDNEWLQHGVRTDPDANTTQAQDQQTDRANDPDEPLFLDYDNELDEDEDRDLDSNPSHHDQEADILVTAVGNPTISTVVSGVSGAQLCDDLLRSSILLNVPVNKAAKSKRDERREEMARRVQERAISGSTPRPEIETSGENRRALNEIPLFEEIEDVEEEDVGGHQPTATQLRRRKEFGLGSRSGLSVLEMGTPDISDIASNGDIGGPTQVAARDMTQLSSLPQDQGPPAKNPGHSIRSSGTTPATMSVRDPTAESTLNPKLKKTSTTSKYFQPPRAVAKETRDDSKAKSKIGASVALASSSSAPRWATVESR